MLSMKKTSIIDTNHFFFVKYFLKNCVHEYNVFTFSTLLLSLQFPSFPKSLLDFNNYYCHTQTHVHLYLKTLLDPFSVPFMHMYVGSTKWSCITYQASCPWRWKLILPPSAASHCLQFLILVGGLGKFPLAHPLALIFSVLSYLMFFWPFSDDAGVCAPHCLLLSSLWAFLISIVPSICCQMKLLW